MTRLTVIILSYNTRELTIDCLKSIEYQELSPISGELEVIVSDNGSNDGTVEEIKKRFDWVKILENKKNLGYAAGNNRAINESHGKIIALLNSDTLVQDDSLSSMLAFMENNRKVGAATPRLELPDGSLDLACHRGFPTPWNAASYFLRLERLFPESKLFARYHQTWKDFNVPHEVDAISGACFFIKKKVVDKVGPLDERYFMYAEDIDWCMRIKKAGWKIFYNPNTKVIHKKKQSGRKRKHAEEKHIQTQSIRKESNKHFYETMKLYYRKHYQERYPNWINRIVFNSISLLSKIKNFKEKHL